MKEFNNINDILDFAMQSEQEAVDFYNQLSENASNEEMKQVFLQFATEEMGHKKRLANLKEQGIYKGRTEEVADLKIADYVVEVEPKPDMSYEEALVVAMKKEKAAFRLYSDLAKKAPNDEIKAVFDSLAIEESKHKLRFELEYDDIVYREN